VTPPLHSHAYDTNSSHPTHHANKDAHHSHTAAAHYALQYTPAYSSATCVRRLLALMPLGTSPPGLAMHSRSCEEDNLGVTLLVS